MKHILPNGEHDTYSVGILLRRNSFNSRTIKKYISPYIKAKDLVVFDLEEKNQKVAVGVARKYLGSLLPALNQLGTTHVLVCDGSYYKELTGTKTLAGSYGYVKPCKVKGFEHLNIILGINPASFFTDPSGIAKLTQGIDALNSHKAGTYVEIGKNVLHNPQYPSSLGDIKKALSDLHKYDKLSADIETKSLKFWEAGLETIAFAWSAHEGVAFTIDRNESSELVRAILKDFLCNYKGKLIWHNAGYDLSVLIYELWMNNLLDQRGLLEGLFVVTKNFGDTQVETYLATNSCSGNTLGLKPNTQEHLGDYAEDTSDTTLISNKDLLRYNLMDSIGTYWLHEKMHPTLIQDNQESIYNTIFLPSIRLLLHVGLTGMCISMPRVLEAEKELIAIQDRALAVIHGSVYTPTWLKLLRQKESDVMHSKWKTKTATIDHFDYVQLNPNSGTQLAILLHEVLDLPILETTKTGLPATGADVIEMLINHTNDDSVKELLEAFIDLAKVSKILTSFIPAFKNALLKDDGNHYLHGSYKVTGTLSGRLSCTDPPMQTIPSGSMYAKIIKRCFMPPDRERLFVGSDYNALESTVGAKITQDPNRMKIFTEGWDSHCFNTFKYKMSPLPGIVETVDSVNSIKKLFPDARQDSKEVTFALDYLGTWMTVKKSTGKSKDDSIRIYDNYHETYKVSDAWRDGHLLKAEKVGYVEGAFGLRVRTHVIKRSVMGTRVTPRQADAEKRSAGNALTQSYCMLNSRSSIEFMERVYNSKYRYLIQPVALIHDACYLIIPNDLEALMWVNKNLVECMSWVDLPELQQDDIPLGGELDVFHDSWATHMTIPNHASIDDIIELADKHK